MRIENANGIWRVARLSGAHGAIIWRAWRDSRH